MKSEVFNGQRFWSYFKYDLVQMWRNHMTAAIGIGLSGFVVYVVTVLFNLIVAHTWSGPGFEGRLTVMFLAFLALQLYQTRTYGYLTDRRKGSAWLMLPASTTEKWVSMLLMTLIVIPVLFVVVFFGVDALLCLADKGIGESLMGSIAHIRGDMMSSSEYVISPGMAVWILLMGFFGNFLYMLLCGICFRKNKILWAIAITVAVSILLSGILGPAFARSSESIDLLVRDQAALDASLLWSGIITTIYALGLAGGVFARLKTIKH